MKKNRVDEFIKRPNKALFTLATPMLIGMLVQTTYNLVDTAFVGRLGTNSIAALTFAFPVFMIIWSLNSGIGVGMSSLISRLLGAKKRKEAENAAMHGLLSSVMLAVVLFFGGIWLLPTLFNLFGATGEVLTLSTNYMTIIFFGMIFMFLNFAIYNIFASQGDTKTPMKIQVTALVINIILDPIFIYILGYGVAGAAIATVLAFMIAFAMGLYYIPRKSQLRIRKKSFVLSFSIIKQILVVGIPATLMMLLISFSNIVVNRFMVHFSTLHVAAYGIVSRLESVLIMPMVAFSTSAMTLAGMFFGAKRYNLLKGMIRFAAIINLLIALFIGIIFFAIPAFLMQIFTPDLTVIQLGATYLRIDVFLYPFLGVTMLIARVMQGMGKGLPGLVMNFVRVIAVTLPLSYIFIFILGYGYLSVAIAFIIGAVASAIIGLIWLSLQLRKCVDGNNTC